MIIGIAQFVHTAYGRRKGATRSCDAASLLHVARPSLCVPSFVGPRAIVGLETSKALCEILLVQLLDTALRLSRWQTRRSRQNSLFNPRSLECLGCTPQSSQWLR
jgi:hypothetical protein